MSAASKAARRGEVERHLRAHTEGMTASELAERMGVSPSTVRRTLTDPEFAREVPVVSEGHRWRIDEDQQAEDRTPAARFDRDAYESGFKTMAEWRAGITESDLQAYRDYSDDFAGAIEHGMSVFGSADVLERWLATRQVSLGNRTPLSFLIEGDYERIHTILGYIEHGIVA